MPKLLAFLPCEKVIIGEDHSVSLIAVLQSMTINVPSDAPKQITIPMTWTTFTLWSREPEDDDVRYEQRVELVAPSKAVALTQTAEFQMTKPFHRQMGSSFGLPLPESGPYTLRLSLRRLGDPSFQTIAEYPWELDRVNLQQPAPA